jgi:hypothetical protein
LVPGVRIYGGAEALRKDLGRGYGDEHEVQIRNSSIAEARSGLGEEAFSAAWEHGEAMTAEDTFAFALQASRDSP